MVSEETKNTEISQKVAAYIEKHKQWDKLLSDLRELFNTTELDETIKWGAPCYVIDKKIVASLGAFNNHCAIWFHQGVLLEDSARRLLDTEPSSTKALRQWRFENNKLTDKRLVLSYVKEAIANQKAGKVFKPEKKALEIPELLEQTFKEDKALEQAFQALTPGKQKDYANHIADAKQEKTRLTRLAKITPMILAGAGLHDKYRNC